MLFLKCLPLNLRAHKGFEWPSQVGNIVESETWDPNPVCGGGLHGLNNGKGSSDMLPVSYTDTGEIWLPLSRSINMATRQTPRPSPSPTATAKTANSTAPSSAQSAAEKQPPTG